MPFAINQKFEKGKLKSLAKESFWVGFGLTAGVLGMLGGTRLLTTLLSADEYGKLALAMSLGTMVVQVGGEPVAQTALRFYSHWQKIGKSLSLLRSIAASLVWILALIAVMATMVIILGNWIEGVPGIGFILLVAFLALLLVLNRIALALEDALRKRRMRAILQGSFEIGRFSMAAALILLTSCKNAETVLLGFVSVAVVVVIAHVCFLNWGITGRRSRSYEKEKGTVNRDGKILKRFLLPLIASHTCIWIVMMAERWALNYHGSLADVGGYTAVHQLAFVPMVIVTNFGLLVTTPIIYQFVGAGKNTEMTYQALRFNRHLAFGIIGITLIGFGILTCLHSVVGRILLGSEFRNYSWMFPWLLLAGGFFAAAHQLLIKLTCEFRTRSLAILWGVMSIIALTAYFACAQLWQMKGLVTSVVGVNGLLMLFALFVAFQVHEEE